MTCPKCSGFMVLEKFSDFFLAFYAHKCVNCGCIMDQTIAQNRLNSKVGRSFSRQFWLEQEKVRA